MRSKLINFPKTSGIYCYENTINNKKYIGLAINLHKRINDHERNFKKKNFDETNCGENKPLWYAVKKYKRKNFSVSILEECPINALEEREKYYIKFLRSHITENGYNILWGGFSRLGTKHTDESKKKMSENNPRPFLGKHHSEENKKTMNLSKKGVPLSDEHKKKIRESNPKPFLGGHHSEESKKKMSDWHKNKVLSEEHKKNISNANKGKKRTSEEIEKISLGRILAGTKEKGRTSQYYGVYYQRNCNKWAVQVRHNKKYSRLGLFKKEMDAAKAYDKYVIENNLPNPLNFPEDYK